MVMKPNFLKPAQRATRLNRRIADPYVAATMQLTQIERFLQSEIGKHPSIDVLKSMTGGQHNISSGNLDCQNTELHLLSSSLPTPTIPQSLEKKHLYGLLESAGRINKKFGSGFHVVCEVSKMEEPGPGADAHEKNQWIGKSAADKASHLSVTFRLYLDPKVKHGGFSPEPTFWGPEKELLTYVLTSPGTIPSLRAGVEGNFPVKENLFAEDILLPSRPNFGSFADLSEGVEGLLCGIIRENLRIGISPPGFAPEDPHTYHRATLPPTTARMLGPETEAAKAAKSKESSIASSRYHGVAESLVDVMSDLENLGHTRMDESAQGVGRLLRGLNCELRPALTLRAGKKRS